MKSKSYPFPLWVCGAESLGCDLGRQSQHCENMRCKVSSVTYWLPPGSAHSDHPHNSVLIAFGFFTSESCLETESIL